MPASDREPAEAHDTPETQDPAELGRIAHKIAWARMNGSVDAANPFVDADPNRPPPRNRMNSSSRPR
jgi:hypothetical protein